MIKISRPLQKGLSPRPRLFKQIDLLRRSPAIWISAPAGSGKTSLLTSYIEQRRIPCFWYQMDKDDTDAANFFCILREATVKSLPKKSNSLPMFTHECLLRLQSYATRFFDSFYQCLDASHLVVFDNYQEVNIDSMLHEIMQIALSRIPRDINVVILSRTDPPAQLIRLQANSGIEVLRWEDIRFTENEARGIINNRHKKQFSRESLQHLYRLSGGWAAGLVLISDVARRERLDLSDLALNSFDDIFSYLAKEAFESLDNETRLFLLKTAIFPKMTVQMAMDLTNHPSAASILQSMTYNNYFMVRNAASVYEYHPLYREFLLSVSHQALGMQALRETQHCAARILKQAGQIEAAMDLLIITSDWNDLADCITLMAFDLIKQGRHQFLLKWLHSLPETWIDTNPWLKYWLGECCLPVSPLESLGHFEHSFALFQRKQDISGTLLSAAGCMDAILYQWDNFKRLDPWIEFFEVHLEKEITSSEPQIQARVLTSICGALMTRMPQHINLRSWFEKAWKASKTCNSVDLQMRSGLYMVNIYSWQGDRIRSEAMLALIEKMAASEQVSPTVKLASGWLAAGMDLWFKGSADDALTAAVKGLAFSRESGIHVWDDMLFGLGTFGAIVKNDLARAAKFLDEFRLALNEHRLHGYCQYHYLTSLLSLNRNEQPLSAMHAKRALEIARETGYIFPEILCLLQLAYALCGHEETKKLARLLAEAKSLIIKSGSSFLDFMYLLTQAHVSFHHNTEQAGLKYLKKAMRIGKQQNYSMLMYWWEPTLMANLCAKALTNDIETGYVQALIRKRNLVPRDPSTAPENWPWAVKIYTLGRFGIIQNGTPLHAEKKAQQVPLRLVKILLAHGGREMAEEHITNLLWPDADGDKAHHAFESTLLRVRKIFANPKALRFRDGKLSLDDRYCWTDIWAFERLMAQAAELSAQNNIEEAILTQKKAVRLYRGAFLAGEGAEPWILAHSERLKRKFVKGILLLGRCLESVGAWEDAAAHYEKCLEIDECNEVLFRNLMICNKHLGRNSNAMSIYLHCQKILADRLGVAPSPSTEAVRLSLSSK